MEIKSLSLDLETRSSVDISKCGVYKYAESPDFEILLFGVSINHGPITVYDLASGDTVPEAIVSALVDHRVIKWAYNASFERVCLSIWLRKSYPEYFCSYGTKGDPVQGYLDPASWKCTLVWAAYNGLPLGLEKVGAVLGFEEQKLKEGKELIKYFCCPCRPTKANGGRTWNLPQHAPDKWALFKKYNERDVLVEMQIQERLGNYPVPDFVWDEYHLDQEINDRGILMDTRLVEQAIRMDGLSRESLMTRMREVTGLDNPNSVQQMKEYLSAKGLNTETLGKKDVAAMLDGAKGDVAEALSLRLQVAKSSVKKYQAMQSAACADGRCRGMFRFYGANRTGRWSSTILNLQNLYRNSMPDLAEARALVRAGDYEMLYMLYDSVPEALAELVRTAFIPRPGYKFIVSDFSAIEARVLSHLAGEKWRSDLFQRGGDIYCQSASKMFGVPVEKHGVNAELRQKGKVAELACIAKGQLVLTDQGLVPIEDVTLEMRLWDGEEWVTHGGVVDRGEREVITYEGLTATPDHLVWTEGEPGPVQLGVAAARGARLVQTGDGRRAIRLGKDHRAGETLGQGPASLLCPDKVPGVRVGAVAAPGQPEIREVERVPGVLPEEDRPPVAAKKADRGKAKVREPQKPWVPQLRSARDKIRVPERNGCRPVPYGELRDAGPNDGDRPHRHERELRAGEPPFRRSPYKLCEPAAERAERVRPAVLAIRLPGGRPEALQRDDEGRDHRGRGAGCGGAAEELAHHQRTARLYDIRDAGPHHRFTVSGRLVHNCGYGGSTGALKAMGALEMGLSEEELPGLVKAWREANPNIVRFWWDVDTAVKDAIKQRARTRVGNISFEARNGMLFITLPSGRRLAYVKPRIGENKFGGESVTYMGIDAQKKWSRIESYGPKFVENCLAAGTRVLTDRGLVPIERVTEGMRVWDGVEWVRHEGLIEQGVRETVCVDGIRMTPEHRILTERGWIEGGKAEGLDWAKVLFPHGSPQGGPRLADGIHVHETGHKEPVYDLRNCGPRHRFAVRNGQHLCVVSNCVQAVSRDILAYAIRSLKNCQIVGHVHDELIIECPPEISLDAVCAAMGRTPPWLPGIDLKADGYECSFYMKS